ncbi:MAG: sulfatase maturase [Rhodospirillales bacterium 20-64-7]|nr:MAG: sulfatase maturase [Rhodospirillales bacterium 20-64-7]HQT78680.1 ergothioneine biosynthesis protein EgtB [Rhodopila sp.]
MDPASPSPDPEYREHTSDRFRAVRDATEALAEGLTEEDQCVQSMPDSSPVKWHRAHTTWFFEQFVLRAHAPGYEVFDPDFCFLFNSYYDTVGPRHPRPSRGLLTRPAAAAVAQYRRHVDAAMIRALPDLAPAALPIVELGLQHEQQHQELLVTDMLHAFAGNPLYPAMWPGWQEQAAEGTDAFVQHPGGLCQIGWRNSSFCFDNETPTHQVWLEPFALASRLVRNRDWLDFMHDGGYRTPTLWMSDGWAVVQSEGWSAPLHWRDRDDAWFQVGPGGLAPLALDAPVRHISWYEADAFARWRGARLPTEAEWEAAHDLPGLHQMTGHVWQWTESAYRPYPGFRAVPGAIGEYNGKFMINQMVLRGGSLATPTGHLRPTYRNFFHPDKRWQFSGLRLAKDS